MEKHKEKKKVVRVYDCHNVRLKFVCKPSCGNPPVVPSKISIIPTVNRYFYIPADDIELNAGATLPANLFYNDIGSQTTHFMSYIPNGYANLYINAMIQEGGIYSVNSDSIHINPVNSTIRKDTPIILELLSFQANASY